MVNSFDYAFRAATAAGRSPCFECKDRKLLCHDKCSKFIKWRKVIEMARKEIQKEELVESYEREQRGLRELRRYTYYVSTK